VFVSEASSKPVPTAAQAHKAAGFKAIITYKFLKASLMLGVALWLTLAPHSAYRTLDALARDFDEGGLIFGRLGRWIHDHLSNTFVAHGAILAWLDSISSAVEGGLLLSGKTWAEWVVIISLALLLPFEAHSIWHRPSVGKVAVLGANALIVGYLARAQLLRARAKH
jgi:hypothetical protein